jgi:flagellar hook protein FlgE
MSSINVFNSLNCSTSGCCAACCTASIALPEALSGFTSPENLSPYNTTLFEANGEVGNEFYTDTTNIIIPESVEASTVNLEEEFARMITVQRAYSLNAQSLTVNDEMISLLVDLKS